MTRRALVSLACLTFTACGSSESQIPAANITAAKQALTAEPRVQDLLHQPGQAVEWNLGVLDDGTARHGFAQYACGVLAEHKAVGAGTRVRVVDITKVKAGTNIRNAELGAADCAAAPADPGK